MDQGSASSAIARKWTRAVLRQTEQGSGPGQCFVSRSKEVDQGSVSSAVARKWTRAVLHQP